MTIVQAVLLAVLAAAIGAIAGSAINSRLQARAKAREDAREGLTVSQVLDLVVSSSPIGIAVVDEHQHVLMSNLRVEELGVVRNHLLDDRAWVASQKVFANGESVDFDVSEKMQPFVRGAVAVRGHAHLLHSADPRIAVIYAEDDSEQVRMEATRRDFVANVSHELKTPVGAVSLLTEALLESVDDPDSVRHFGEKMLHESNRLGNMVSELIALSRLQGAEKLPDLDVVDVDSVVSEAMERSSVSAEAAEITITTDFPSGLEVLGDRTLLVTALTNLLSNAISYSPPKTPVTISRNLRDTNVEISVTDRGIGIAPEYHERVFERFFRVDKARSRATGGTGLGLAIVKHVAANHNGSIRMWSRPGTGSTFTLVLPVYVEADDAAEETPLGRGPGEPRVELRAKNREEVRR
ncbi:sensor histidine kinase [Hoyosella subflava]|uniref:Sensor-like histidine kinase SenX3 n=1 Tax=Hoyosella subflava (strain DSM 45089 / JCM 17490 / NBRC 109087 / DQS3-9A1) TaxID=443218 RepID=F6EJN3_HOYSD|nr:ATP-binding protein [Hoyosella subflava]AEF39082.1 Sensor histidine kinase [Hoyosella subflava DQS3-9A1]